MHQLKFGLRVNDAQAARRVAALLAVGQLQIRRRSGEKGVGIGIAAIISASGDWAALAACTAFLEILAAVGSCAGKCQPGHPTAL